jgi:hypothetical protein
MLTLVKGSLVGDKKSSHAITEEYAKADPIYVAKTAVSCYTTTDRSCTNPPPGLTAKVFALSSDTG